MTMPEFCRMLDAYLRYYNEERPKEKLGWMSPMQYRRSLRLAAWPVQRNVRIPIAETQDVWGEWFAGNDWGNGNAALSAFTITFVLAALAAGLNDLFSGI